jgi:HK97 family phage major capsid protein/HK97 family phage prohead protease
MKKFKAGSKLHRVASLTRADVNEENRTVSLAFSSELPVERYWGNEILSHDEGAIRLERLSDKAPLLVDHDMRDHVGVIERVEIGDGRVGRAVVRFGKSQRAEEIYQDVLDGIRTHVSVGYMVHKATLVEERNDGADTYRIDDWEPFEVSMVSIPADHSVGVGRSLDVTHDENPIIEIKSDIKPDNAKERKMSVDNTTEDKKPEIDFKQHEQRGADFARKQINDILAIGEQYGCRDLAQKAVQEQKSIDEFKDMVMAEMRNKPINSSDIGMSDKETKNYSFLRALNALANPGDRKAQEAAKFERDASDAFAEKQGRAPQGFYVPHEVQRRDLVVGTDTAGGHTVSTDLLGQSFIEILRNRMMVQRMGAQMLTGLSGNVAIPRATGGAAAYWVAESGAPTESQAAFDQVTMSPKTLGAYSDISRKLLLQSSIDVEGFVRRDIATVVALAIDAAAINGSGSSNQPTGILNTAGIGAVVGGTNGLAPTWAHVVELWSDIANANADFGNMGMLTNSKVIGKFMSTLKASGVAGYICESFPDSQGITNVGGMRAGVSNQVPSNLTKGTSSGVASAIINGNWADLIIGQWGSLDLMVDPYSNSTSGTVRVVALQDIDIAVRHAESFSAMKDALTT